MTADEKEDAAFELLRQATEAMTRLATAMEQIAVELHIIAGVKSGGGLP